MPTIIHSFLPNDTVFVLDRDHNCVNEGVCQQLTVKLVVDEDDLLVTHMVYLILLGDESTVEVVEEDLYATVGDALAELQAILTT